MPSPSVFDRALHELLDFATAEPGSAERVAELIPDQQMAEWEAPLVMAWLAHGHEDEEGRTAVDRYLDANPKLPRQARAALEPLRSAWPALLVVEESRPGRGLRLRDRVRNQTLEIEERIASRELSAGDSLFAWLMPARSGVLLTGAALPLPEDLATALEKVLRRFVHGAVIPARADRSLSRAGAVAVHGVLRFAFGSEPEAPAQKVPRPVRRPKPAAALPAGTLYAFRLGPVDFDEGENASLYAGVIDGKIAEARLSTSAAEGLKAVAAAAPGAPLLCEQALASAAGKLGFVAAPLPPDVARIRAAFAFRLASGGSVSEEVGPFAGLSLLDASAELLRQKPWRLWSDSEPIRVEVEGLPGVRKLEAILLGNAGIEHGIAVYAPGGSRRLNELADAGKRSELRKIEARSLLFADEPRWAVKALRDGAGLPWRPVPFHLLRGKHLPASTADVLLLAGVAGAVSRLDRSRLEAEYELEDRGERIVVRVRALPPGSGAAAGKH